MLIRWSWDGKTILNYPGRSNIITRVFKSGRGRQKESQRRKYDHGRSVKLMPRIEKDWLTILGSEGGMNLWAKKCSTFRSWNRQGMESALEPLWKELSPAENLILAQRDPHQPSECQKYNIISLSSVSHLIYNSGRKQILLPLLLHQRSVTIFWWIYFFAHYSFHLIYVPIILPIPCYLDYCSFIVKSWNWIVLFFVVIVVGYFIVFWLLI